jgi:hypothetical protein
MFYNVKDLIGYNILAKDGEIGKVHDLLFEDDEWTLRYLVVDTGPWILGRRVLISLLALGEPDRPARQFPVSLTREQVKDSPDIDTEKPVSRQRQVNLHRHYGWPYYWASTPGNLGTVTMTPLSEDAVARAATDATSPENREDSITREEQGDPHLRSAREIFGYSLKANDGAIGQVAGLLVDETWDVRYLVIDTGAWLPGKQVLIPPGWIEAIRHTASEVAVEISRDKIKNSPAYDPAAPLDREYEQELHAYYHRPGYWR